MESKEVEKVHVSQLGLAVGERRAKSIFLVRLLMLLDHRNGLRSPLIVLKVTGLGINLRQKITNLLKMMFMTWLVPVARHGESISFVWTRFPVVVHRPIPVATTHSEMLTVYGELS